MPSQLLFFKKSSSDDPKSILECLISDSQSQEFQEVTSEQVKYYLTFEMQVRGGMNFDPGKYLKEVMNFWIKNAHSII